jgi:hypothetical protein
LFNQTIELEVRNMIIDFGKATAETKQLEPPIVQEQPGVFGRTPV